MKLSLRFKPNAIVAVHDAFMAGASFVLAVFLRLNDDFAAASSFIISGTVIFVAISVPIFFGMGLYRGLWRYASLQDLVRITKAVTLSIIVFAFVMFFISRLEGVPRSVPAINWLLLMMMLGGPRFLYRMLKDRILEIAMHRDQHMVPVLLVGATPSADLFIRELQRNPNPSYRVVGILDDNRQQKGCSISGVRICGTIAGIHKIVRKLERLGDRPQRIIITEDIAPSQLHTLLEDADTLGMTLGRLPRLSEFKEGLEERFTPKSIAPEDLLNRAQNTQIKSHMHEFIVGKRVLVTGAGGSIGGELCRQIAACGPETLVLFDSSEFALYSIDQELSFKFPQVNRYPVLGDVRTESLVQSVFKQYHPDIVFHAAAVKHVPLSEQNPLEAIGTNVIGTHTVAKACQRHGVAAMVLISTDKAVNPSSLMGATKRLAERVLQAQAEGEAGAEHAGRTQYVTVRFGNVLGSAGSVVPLFQKQIERGGPITVTHPDMVRYFMTIREAVELVIHSVIQTVQSPQRLSALYVLDMGTAVRIADLAQQMIRLSGLKPEHDIKIIYTGLRPGEKLYEELFYAQEQVTHTDSKNIMHVHGSFKWSPGFASSLAELERHTLAQEKEASMRLLRELVPEYQALQTESDKVISIADKLALKA